MGIKENVHTILEAVGSETTVVVAVKYAMLEQIMAAVDGGATDLGFNTYQQMEEVAGNIVGDAKLHFIGTLQRNKVKKVVALKPALIQSVDSCGLCEKINDAAKKINRVQDILIQVKTDENKSAGVLPDEMGEILQRAEAMSHVNVSGLMTVHPYSLNHEDSRQYFRKMKLYFEKSCDILGRRLEYLSMGMSSDYGIAIDEGANMVRVGSAIFR